jgi:hypothetical protein
VESLDQLAINKKWVEEVADYNWGKLYGLRGIEMVVELLKEYTAQLQITFMAACTVVVALRADSLCTWICMVVGSSPTRSNNVIKETGVFQTYSIAFSRFTNFHREFSNFPIAFCNVFSKINLINNNNNLRITI